MRSNPSGVIGAIIRRNERASLHEMATKATTMARLGAQLVVTRANVEGDFDNAFATLGQAGAGALLVAASPFFDSRHAQIIALASRYAVPAMFEHRSSRPPVAS
jgi:putative ABC transport system substrate-binding protein